MSSERTNLLSLRSYCSVISLSQQLGTPFRLLLVGVCCCSEGQMPRLGTCMFVLSTSSCGNSVTRSSTRGLRFVGQLELPNLSIASSVDIPRSSSGCATSREQTERWGPCLSFLAETPRQRDQQSQFVMQFHGAAAPDFQNRRVHPLV